MATSLVSSLAPQLNHEALSSSYVLPKSSFFSGSKLFVLQIPRSNILRRTRRCQCLVSAKTSNYDHIPKQFREENLKDGLMENFKNVPKQLYGLTPSQMDMFMREDGLVNRQSSRVTEESISAKRNYLDNGGAWSMSTVTGPQRYSMSVSMYRGGGGGGGGGGGKGPGAPPDLPSLLLDGRIVYLGMPIVPAVTELIIAQFMYLDYNDSTKPIYLYINSSGTQNEKMETVGSETEAFAIADAMCYVKPDIYTINCGMAYGQAAMLLALGNRGKRSVLPHSSTKLYLPKVNRSTGAAIDMWIKAKELDSNTDYYVELLAQGTGKSKEEIYEGIKRPKYLQAQAAIDYGLADKIADKTEKRYHKKDKEEITARSRSMGLPEGGSSPAPSGFR